MNITQVLAELRAERAAVEEAILVLQRIAAGGPRRRGRPPKWMRGAAPQTAVKQTFSAATRARMTMAQRERRAGERKAARAKIG